MTLLNKKFKKLLIRTIHGNATSYTKYQNLTLQPSLLTVAYKRSELDLEIFSFVIKKLKKLTIGQLDHCNALLLFELVHIYFHSNINEELSKEFIEFVHYSAEKGSLAFLKLCIMLDKPSDDKINEAIQNLHKRTLKILSERIPNYVYEYDAHEDNLSFYAKLIDQRIKVKPTITVEELVQRPFYQQVERQLTTNVEELEYQEHAIQQMKEMKAILLSYKENISPDEHKKMMDYFEAATHKNIIKTMRNDYMAERYLGYFMLKSNQPHAQDNEYTSLYKKNNLHMACIYLTRAAQAGDPYAMLFLGKCQLDGLLSIERDKMAGIFLIKNAAVWGLLSAQQELGHIYFEHGLYKEASICYQLAIDQGDATFANKLARCHRKIRRLENNKAIEKQEVRNGEQKVNEIFPTDLAWECLIQENDDPCPDIFPNDFGWSDLAEESVEPLKKKQKKADCSLHHVPFYSSRSLLFKPSAPSLADQIGSEQFMRINKPL